jgi:hypothetical protein
MSVYIDQMFNATATATALTQMNSGITTTAGTYPVPVNGRILKVIIQLAGQAATSLLEALRVDLNCTVWTPNVMRWGAVGGAIRTAPASAIPTSAIEVDQPVNTAQPITGQYLFNVAAVTPNIQVFGQFSTLSGPVPGLNLAMQ